MMNSTADCTPAPRRLRRRGVAAILTAALVLAGCGSSSDTESSGPATSGAPTSTAAVDATEPAAATCVTDPETVVATEPTPESTTATLPTELVAELDQAAQASFAEAAAPGAIVGVRTPEGTWTAAYGDADPEAGTPMEVGMHTRIGSVTKTLTGTLVLQLVEQGELSLEDTIDQYIDGVPNGDRINLEMLGNMTSGVASYTMSPEFTDVYFADPDAVFTPDQILAVGLGESPIFEPGERFDYSNTNTVLLGMVVEKVTGESIGDVYAEGIFEPLGLDDTVWPGESSDIPEPYPRGFTLQGDTATPDDPSNATHWNPAWGWTAGELISTMDDLLVYDRALATGQGMLDADTQIARLTSFPGEAGYGFAVGCVDGWVGHTGELPGYNTSVYHDTDNDTSVVVQVNSDIASGDCPESPTLADDPGDLECSGPATRIFRALSAALGHPFTPPSPQN